MGSGCTQKSSKKDSCFTKLSDECVIYTGEGIESLGICQGDRLSEVESVILQKILDYSQSTGITVPNIVSNCSYVTGILANKGTDLTSRLQTLFDAICNLDSRLQVLENSAPTPFAFDLKCLDVPTTISTDTVLQSTINKTCKNTDDIATIFNQLANDTSDDSILNAVVELIGNKLLSQITSCQNNIVKTGSGASAALQFTAQVPIRGMVFGDFNISSFDNTGLGLASAGMCGWAIANSQNGTVDMRGFTAAGSNSTSIPGGALNAMVQSGFDTDLQMNVGARKGSYKVNLQPPQIPNHTHTVTDPGHYHTMQENRIVGGSGNAFPLEGLKQGSGAYVSNITENTSTSTTGITVGGVTGGSGVAHENRPPTYYGIWIQRIS